MRFKPNLSLVSHTSDCNMSSKQETSVKNIALNFGCAASAAGIAELITLPLDTLKVRMQLAANTGVTPGFTATAMNIVKQVRHLILPCSS